jgi:hypothetical protein
MLSFFYASLAVFLFYFLSILLRVVASSPSESGEEDIKSAGIITLLLFFSRV